MPREELAYRYDAGPIIELWRWPLPGTDRWMHRLDVQSGRSGVVVIVTDGESVLLQRQWRAAVGEHVWQFPRGFGESGDARADARRELLEETGLATTSARALGRMLTDPGLLSASVAVVQIDMPDLPDKRFTASDGAEQIDEFRLMSWSDVSRQVADGRLVDGLTLGAIALRDAVERAR